MTPRTSALVVALLFVLAWILWAGLRPFEFNPPNRVTWIDGDAGLRFDGGGMAVSADEAVWDTASAPARFELELVLRAGPTPADLDADHQFFVLFDELRVPGLVLYQTGNDLVVADRVTNPTGDRWYNDFRAPEVFAAGEIVRLRVVDEGLGPRIFLDGQPAQLSSGYEIPIGRPGEPVRGRVLLGADPDGQKPWTGELLALTLADGETTLARYGFTEGAGPIVRNEAGQGLELRIPRHFRSLRPSLGLALGSAFDLLKNLLGFVPFGYLLAALLRGRPHAILLVTCVGFGLSLTIELAQTLMVSRISSLPDLLLNTLGALAGALVVRARRPGDPREDS